MRKEGIPRTVLEAMHDKNSAVLSAMGRKGAATRAESKRLDAIERVRRNAEIFHRDVESGAVENDEGEIVPPDDLLH